MKPNEVLSDNMESDTEVEPLELFSHLGFLVLEGRCPERSDKGRRDGPHCPIGPSELLPHTCDLDQEYECKRARSVQRQMNMLWKNRIPMCIEVLLFQNCSHGQQAMLASDMGMTSSGLNSTCVLLERWLVQAQPRRIGEASVSARVLFQAVRSYLHFSQLSAWFNLSKGTEPANIGYRVSPPGEFCTSKFKTTPEWHTFPIGHASKSISIKVTLGTLPRLPYIPVPPCSDKADSTVVVTQPKSSSKHVLEENTDCEYKDSFKSSLGQHYVWRDSSPQELSKHLLVTTQGRNQCYSPETTSPRFTKQRVKSLHELEGVCHRGDCEQCRNLQLVQIAKGQKGFESATATQPSLTMTQQRSPSPQCSPQISKGFSPPPPTDRDLGGSRYSPTFSESKMRESGAIPKRPKHTYAPSAPPKSQPDFSDHHALSAPELEAIPDTSSHNSTKSQSKMSSIQEQLQLSSSPKVILTHKSPGSVCYLKDIPSAWALRTLSHECTDSGDNSSPELDRFLNKTLVGKKRIDPLSPQEMEEYLNSLCNVRSKKIDKGLSKRQVLVSDTSGQHLVLTNRTLHNADHLTKPSPQHLRVKLPDVLHFGKLSFDCDALIGSKNCVKYDFDGQESPNWDQIAHSSTSTKDPPIHTDVMSLLSHNSVDKCLNLANSSENKSSGAPLKGLDIVSADKSKIKFTVGEDCDEPCRESSCQGTSMPVVHKHSTDRCSNDLSTESYCDEKPVSNGEGKCNENAVDKCKPRLKKSVSYPRGNFHVNTNPLAKHANSLLKAVIKKEQVNVGNSGNKKVPSNEQKSSFQENYSKSASRIFHTTTGLPLQSSPAPIKRRTSNSFDYDTSLTDVRAIKNSISCVNLDGKTSDNENNIEKTKRMYSSSAPASTNCLLGNFEESLLNGRIEPSGVVDGFTVDIGASGSFCPKHIKLPVTAFFFKLSDDNAPSPYLGHVNFDSIGKRGYHVPSRGTVQVTMFNPNKTVVKMFVVVYDMSDMPPNSQTFLRQRTLYMPVNGGPCDQPGAPIFLRYLIHLRFASSKSGKIYLHTDLRLIFARDKLEFDSRVANYELRSFTEGPTNPKFSPKK